MDAQAQWPPFRPLAEVVLDTAVGKMIELARTSVRNIATPSQAMSFDYPLSLQS